MNIIDNHSLLTRQQINLLNNNANVFFKLGKYSSLDDILTQLNVDICIEPGIPKRIIPPFFDEAIDYWKKEEIRLKNLMSDYESKCEELRNAVRNIEEIYKEKELWRQMILRGLYNPVKNEIILYPEEMKQEYNGGKMDELLVSTLAHETMHAYFNRGKNRKNLSYIPFIEEPLAEFGMLLYLYDTVSTYYYWAYDDVASKKTFYRFGVDLMNQHLNGNQQLRKSVENYKFAINPFAMPKIQNGTIVLPQKVGSKVTVNVKGQSVSSRWNDILIYPPRYFYDSRTKTLGLDGHWGVLKQCEKFHIYHDIGFFIECNINEIDNIYLGDNFFIYLSHHPSFHIISKTNVVVSPKNITFSGINGQLADKQGNLIL